MSTGELSPQELEMQQLVRTFHTSLDERDLATVSTAIANIQAMQRPLQFWLPYKDLAAVIAKRSKEVYSLSDAEITYLKELSDKLWDKDADVGMGTVPEFATKLETLKQERQAQGIEALLEDGESKRPLINILFPNDLEEKVKSYRHTEKGKGIWDTWEKVASIARSDFTPITAAGLTSGLIREYLDLFMIQNMYSNVFQCDMDHNMLKHITKIFQFYLQAVHVEGAKNVETILDTELNETIKRKGSRANGEYSGWAGTREFSLMHVANVCAQESFLSLKWKTYEPEEYLFGKLIEYAREQDAEHAKYLEGILSGCGKNHHRLFEQFFNRSVRTFIKSYVHQQKIDEEAGAAIAITAKYLNGHDLELCQPVLHKAIVSAAENGYAFAQEILQGLNHEGDMFSELFGMFLVDTIARQSSAPYRDYPLEHKEHVEHRAKQIWEEIDFDYIKGAPEHYQKAIAAGKFVAPANEANTPLGVLRQLTAHAKTLTARCEELGVEKYISLGKGVFFIATPQTGTAYVGSPEFSSLLSCLGFWPNSHRLLQDEEQIKTHVRIDTSSDTQAQALVRSMEKYFYGRVDMPVRVRLPRFFGRNIQDYNTEFRVNS